MKWDKDDSGNPDMKHILTILIPFLIVILCLPAILSATSQPSGGKMTESKPALPKTVGSWTRPGSPQLITAKTIFDYMDGAGELYLGYRFDHLEVYEYKAPTQKEILVEIYYMKTSDDAFGLLSLDWGGKPVDLSQLSHEQSQSIPSGSGWPRALYGKGLLRLWSGSIYARIMAYQETAESKNAVLSLSRAVVKGRRNPPPPELISSPPDVLQPDWTLRQESVRFFRTHLVLNSLYYLGHENMLALDHASEAVTCVYEKKDSSRAPGCIRIIKVNYANFDRARSALDQFHASYLPEHPLQKNTGSAKELLNTFYIEDGWMGYRLQWETITFAFECPDQETARAVVHQIK